MSKDNILYSIIGVLLGFIIGFFFANSVNQRGSVPSAQASSAGTMQSGAGSLPPDHPPLASNGVADQGRMQGPMQELIQQARNNPNDFDAQMKAADLYYKIDRYDDAVEFLMRANKLRPESYEAVVQLGNANFDARRYELAEKWYTAALLKNPNDVNVRTDLGLTFLFREPPDYDRAIKEFRGSLERDPNHEQSLQDLVVALTRKGDAKEAGTVLEKLAQVNPTSQALSKLRSDLEKLRASSPSTNK